MSQHWISWLMVTLPFIPIRLEVPDWYVKTLLTTYWYLYVLLCYLHASIYLDPTDTYYLRQHFRKTIDEAKSRHLFPIKRFIYLLGVFL